MTDVETGDHLIQCMVYIDLNMVRAGIVKHPEDWQCGGYNCIMKPPQRYRLTDYKKLMELTEIMEFDPFPNTYSKWVDSVTMKRNFSRQPQWTESFAVGNSFLVNRAKDLMGYKTIGRIVFENDGSFLLRETQSSYESILSIADNGPSEDNTHG